MTHTLSGGPKRAQLPKIGMAASGLGPRKPGTHCSGLEFCCLGVCKSQGCTTLTPERADSVELTPENGRTVLGAD